MNRDGSDAQIKCRFDDSKEIVATLLRIIQTSTHLDGDRNLRWHRVAYSENDLACNIRLSKMIPTATSTGWLLRGTSKIDINHIKPGLNELLRCSWKLIRFRSHQLRADGMVIVRDEQMMPCFGACFQ